MSDGLLDVDACQNAPDDFLTAIRAGEQKLRAGQRPEDVSADVLTATPESRFVAEIEGARLEGSARRQ